MEFVPCPFNSSLCDPLLQIKKVFFSSYILNRGIRPNELILLLPRVAKVQGISFTGEMQIIVLMSVHS